MSFWIALGVTLPIISVLSLLLYQSHCFIVWLELDARRLEADLAYWSGGCPNACQSWGQHKRDCSSPYELKQRSARGIEAPDSSRN